MPRVHPAVILIVALMVPISCGRRPGPEAAATQDSSSTAAPQPDSSGSSERYRNLGDEAYVVAWEKPAVPSPVRANQTIPIQITLRNTSNVAWPDVATVDPVARSAANAVRLSYRWWPSSAKPVGPSGYDLRFDFSGPVEPGESATLLLPIKAPMQPGNYILEFGLVHEMVVWFEDKGAPTLKVPVRVQ